MSEYAISALAQYAKDNQLFRKLRKNVIDKLKQENVLSNSVIALKGAVDSYIWDTDTDRELHYESFSFHVSGITETNFVLIIEIDTEAVHVFVPAVNDILKTFLIPLTPEYIEATYGYKGYLNSSIGEVLRSIAPSCIYINRGTNTDSGAELPSSYLMLPEFEGYKIDDSILYKAFVLARSVKLPEEVEIIRRVVKASSQAHVEAMKNCKPGIYEYSLAGTFRGYISTNYGYIYSFCPISASGNNSAVLHYPSMNQLINDGDMVLCDMGGSGYGWVSDIACTFPANGKFTDKQAGIYNLVLKANRAVINTMKPGTEWTDMHLLAEKIIIEGLIDLGILVGDVEEIQAKRIGAVFFPHGLGHLLGHDVHDVGGYICGHSRSSEPGLKCLRTRRVLEENMVITVEPGCYFIDFAIDSALNNPDTQRHFGDSINLYRGFGGVRIEDDVLVTRDGAEILTDVPRTVTQIEAAIQGFDWRSIA